MPLHLVAVTPVSVALPHEYVVLADMGNLFNCVPKSQLSFLTFPLIQKGTVLDMFTREYTLFEPASNDGAHYILLVPQNDYQTWMRYIDMHFLSEGKGDFRFHPIYGKYESVCFVVHVVRESCALDAVW